MDKNTLETLELNRILDLIQPPGETGKQYKKHLVSWKPGQEVGLRRSYKQLETLLEIIHQQPKFLSQLSSSLAAVPYIPQTLKALAERPLLLHECFEIKKLVHYTRLLQKSCLSHGLAKNYPFPDLENLYALLDPDHLNSPAFALSPAFDTMMAKYLTRLHDFQTQKRLAEQKLATEARKALGLAKPLTEIVISRSQAKEVKQLSQSGYYLLAEENFANLTFRLKATPELLSLEKQIALLSVKLARSEEDVLAKLSKKVRTFARELDKTVDVIRQLDWDVARAMFAREYSCCLPTIVTKSQLAARQAVNLPLKLRLDDGNHKYQPTDLKFCGVLNVLTGPNMGGKSTTLRTVGHIACLTHYALPIPAREAELCLFDNIWCNSDLGGNENLSSFGREIVSLSEALTQPGQTLFLMDELAPGTNPTEGEAILIAVLKHLAGQSCLVLAATHYERPAHLPEAAQYAIKGIDPEALNALAVRDKTGLESQLGLLNSLMDYNPVKITTKTPPQKNAIPIASLLGLPEAVLKLIEM